MGRSHKITIANNERLIRRHVLLVRTAPGMTHHRWALEHLWHYQFSVSPSFLIFAMNMAVILMCTVQYFITIGQTKLMLWTNDISWVCISRWVGGGGGVSYISPAMSASPHAVLLADKISVTLAGMKWNGGFTSRMNLKQHGIYVRLLICGIISWTAL